jgi:predicted MFS family arabinose efflux permease
MTERSASIDIDSRKTIWSTIYLSVIGASVFIIQPGFIQGMVEYLGFSPQQSGFVASAEIWGIAVISVLLAFMSHRVNWHWVLMASIMIFIGGNLGSLIATDPSSFGAWRFIAGLGSGGLVSVSFTVIGLTSNPDRNFGYLIAGVLIYGALGLLAMPTLFALVGLKGLIMFLIFFSMGGILCVRNLPTTGEEHVQTEEDSIDLPVPYRVIAITAMFSYFFAQGVIWAYLFLIGINAGMSEQEVANGLTLSQFLGIAGAFTAAAVGRRYGRGIPLAIGILGGAVVLFLLFGEFTAMIYAITVCVYNYAWNMTHPYLLAAMASFDAHGRVVVYAVAAQMVGLAIGPAFAATLITEGDYSNVIWAGIALFVVSFILIMSPVKKHQKLLESQHGD